jgi:hypothetical protein
VTTLLRDADESTALSAHIRETSQQYSAEVFWERVNEALHDMDVL